MYALLSLMLTEAATHLVRDSAHSGLLSETASIQRCLLPKRNGFPSFALNLNGISEIIETFSHSNKPPISPCEGPHGWQINIRLSSRFHSASQCKRRWTGPRNETQMSNGELGGLFKLGQTQICRTERQGPPCGPASTRDRAPWASASRLPHTNQAGGPACPRPPQDSAHTRTFPVV